jgi:hypothetical protein
MSARPSYLMDYGPDYPPAPAERDEAVYEPMTLAQRCFAAVVLWAVCWAAGALLLHALNPQPRGPVSVVIWHDETPARGHGTDVTTTLLPHPATPARRP